MSASQSVAYHSSPIAPLIPDAITTDGSSVSRTNPPPQGDPAPNAATTVSATNFDHTHMRERRVPETPMARLLAFSTLGLGLAAGAAAESARRLFNTPQSEDKQSVLSQSTGLYSAFVSDANARRLADSLSRMRGAALKLGQMLSIQDEGVVPPVVLQALERVRQSADVMPKRQLEAVMVAELGDEWKDRVLKFEQRPMAAASIGQVHRAVILGEEGDEVDVVFKVQYPGVARSIKSDLSNLKRLVTVGNLVPDSFYLDEALAAAEEELAMECDYRAEAESQAKYRELVLSTPSLRHHFYVPKVFMALSTQQLLVSEHVRGVPIDKVADMPEDIRNKVANRMLRLALSELFVFGFQQSDPNFSNYLYDVDSDTINLIDFGASRAYSQEFLLKYLQLITACAEQDREDVIRYSIDLGFLTGSETREMFDAHVAASFAVGEPFHESNAKGFNFQNCDIPARTANFGKVMLKHRLTPPPKEAYSLHRRLSGAFLMSTRLKSVVQAREMLYETADILRTKGKIDI